MLDLREIMEQKDQVWARLKRRPTADSTLLDSIIDEGKRRLTLIQESEQLKAKRNEVSKEIGKRKAQKQPADDLMKETGSIGDRIKALDEELGRIQSSIDFKLLSIPNLPDTSVPEGVDAEANKEIHKIGVPKQFSFKPKSHDELGTALGLIDFERAATITGARFTVLWGDGARLERALIQFMLDIHTREHGYTEVLPPFIVNTQTLTGTGQLPKFKEELFHLDLKDHDYYLIPTAEVPVTNLHAGEILDENAFPLAYCAYTPCFRAEAGSYGRDVKGLIRQHQFNKVELVRFSLPEKSMEALEELTAHAEVVLKRLELPFRRMLLCTGDMGFGATKTYDLEVWLPSQNTYREISSCSNCGDFQARRAKIRYRPAGHAAGQPGSKTQFVHTLNGSGIAVGRTLIAIFENFQDENGRVAIPKALQPYMGGQTHLNAYPLKKH